MRLTTLSPLTTRSVRVVLGLHIVFLMMVSERAQLRACTMIQLPTMPQQRSNRHWMTICKMTANNSNNSSLLNPPVRAFFAVIASMRLSDHSVCLPSVCLSICLPVYLSIYLSVALSILDSYE